MNEAALLDVLGTLQPGDAIEIRARGLKRPVRTKVLHITGSIAEQNIIFAIESKRALWGEGHIRHIFRGVRYLPNPYGGASNVVDRDVLSIRKLEGT